VTVLPWHRNAAFAYAEIRHLLQSHGKRLEPLDLMIAAHAKAAGAVLVSRDKSYRYLCDHQCVEDWTD
jgi:tRNA(fMet)-specific endonuclease VapC